jgi:hypothetical protein
VILSVICRAYSSFSAFRSSSGIVLPVALSSADMSPPQLKFRGVASANRLFPGVAPSRSIAGNVERSAS